MPASATRLIDVLLGPAATLMGRLRLVPKFVLVAAVLVLPTLYATRAYMTTQDGQIAFSAAERDGVTALGPATDVLAALDQARIVAVGDAIGVSGDADATQAALTAAIAAMDAADASVGGSLGSSAAWSEAEAAIATALDASGEPAEVDAAYGTATAAVVALVTKVGDGSNLILDPDLDSFYLMDATVVKLPSLIDASAGGATRLALRLAAKEDGAAARATAAVDSGTLASTLTAMLGGYGTSFDSTADASVKPAVEGALGDAQGAVESLATSLQGSVAEDGGDPAAILAAGAAATEAAHALSERTLPRLDALIATRIAGFDAIKQRTLLIAIVSLLLAVYLFIGFYRAITRTLHAVGVGLAAAAAGDLGGVPEISARDEIGGIARTLDATLGTMRETMSEVRGAAGRVADAAGQIAERTAISGRSVAEISVAIQDVAQGAERQVLLIQDARAQANAARTSALSGLETSERLGAAMAELDVTSRRIGEIVQSISGIADQTGLLALNAAIEAARAGEQGRGFAVVAEEVRKLASSASEASASITELVGEMQTAAANAVELVRGEAAGSFEDISAGTQQSAEVLEEVVRVAESTSAATEQVFASTSESDDTGRELAATAEQLASTAQELRDLVARFDVG